MRSAVPTAAGSYVHWGVVQISVTNLVIIAVMIAVFTAALFVPFPTDKSSDDHDEQ